MDLTCELWFYISKIFADYRIFGRKRCALMPVESIIFGIILGMSEVEKGDKVIKFRKSLRNANINYRNGWFFVTSQVAHNKSILGAIVGEEMRFGLVIFRLMGC